MRKIVIVSPILQYYRLTFYEKLSRHIDDYHLTVLYGDKKKDDGRPNYPGQTKFNAVGFREFKFHLLSLEIVYNLGMLSEIKQINPDIVILQGITGNITYRRIISWAKRKNKKIIVWVCAWEPGRAKGLLLTFKNKLVASFFRKANYFLTYSSYASNYVRDMGIEQSKIEICYNGLDIDSLIEHHDQLINKSKELIRKYNLDFNISFLFVGALIPDKKPEILLDAFIQLRKKYENIKLIIIGDGPLRSVVEERIKLTMDPNIYYLGRIIEEVDAYFAACDCFVLPGIGGLALNQAMYWGKPCIVSKADGTEDDLVIEGVTGYRFKESDLGSLVSAMERRINENQIKLSKMSEKSRNLIHKRSNVNNMVSIFSDAIDRLSISNSAY